MLSRRLVMSGAGCLVFAAASGRARATESEMWEAMHRALGPLALKNDRVQLDIPALVENGNSVPLTIRVDSAMTPSDYVRDVHVFAPENPLPWVCRFKLGPRCGTAEVKTTVRLATSQTVHVVAVLSDGSQWLGTAEVEVTTAACFDPT